MKLFVKKSKNKQGVKETLWVDFTHNGQRYRKSLKLDNTPANRKLAETKVIPTLQYKVISGEFFSNSNNKIPTVDEYMKKSFELQRGNRSRAVQYDYDKKYHKHIKPIFGDTKINKLDSHTITLWQNTLLNENNLKVKTVKQIRGLLYTMYEDALKEKEPVVVKNPVIGAAQLRKEVIIDENNINANVDEPIKPFTLEEIESILGNSVTLQMRNFFALLFMTGVRLGEAISLTWEKIDFKNKEILINRKVRRGEFGLPKYKSIRKVPILDSLLPYLKHQLTLTGERNGFVFLNQKGNHFWDASKVRENYWKKTLEMNNISYRNPHQTRHTFISTLISAGEDINYVSKIAGHISTKVTLEIYSEYIPNNNKNFGSVFNKKFGT